MGNLLSRLRGWSLTVITIIEGTEELQIVHTMNDLAKETETYVIFD